MLLPCFPWLAALPWFTVAVLGLLPWASPLHTLAEAAWCLSLGMSLAAAAENRSSRILRREGAGLVLATLLAAVLGGWRALPLAAVPAAPLPGVAGLVLLALWGQRHGRVVLALPRLQTWVMLLGIGAIVYRDLVGARTPLGAPWHDLAYLAAGVSVHQLRNRRDVPRALFHLALSYLIALKLGLATWPEAAEHGVITGLFAFTAGLGLRLARPGDPLTGAGRLSVLAYLAIPLLVRAWPSPGPIRWAGLAASLLALGVAWVMEHRSPAGVATRR